MKNIDTYLNSIAPFTASSTVTCYRQHLEAFVTKVGEGRVTPAMVDRHLGELKTLGRSAHTISLRRAAIRQYFEWMVREKHIKENPVRRMKIHLPSSERVPITKDEFAKLLLEARAHWKFMVLAGWHTGLRMGDVALLSWTDIDLPGDCITVVPMKTKRYAKKLTLPIHPELWSWFIEQNPKTGYVCWDAASRYKFDGHKTLSSEFHRMAQRCGITKSFHCFRHAFVSRMLNKGVSPAVVASMTGHSLKQILSYTHIDLTTKRQAIYGNETTNEAQS